MNMENTALLDKDDIHDGERLEKKRRPETLNSELYFSNQISLTLDDISKIPIKEIKGDLVLRDLQTFPKSLELTEIVNGDVDLTSLTSIDGLKLPRIITGSLYLSGLTSTEGLELPEEVKGHVYLRNLSSDEKDELKKKHPKLKIR